MPTLKRVYVGNKDGNGCLYLSVHNNNVINFEQMRNKQNEKQTRQLEVGFLKP